MGLELLAAIICAFCLGGIAYGVRRKRQDRLPQWIVPLAAAVGLIGYTVWSEYSWYPRVAAELPDGVEVVWAERAPNALRPWTFLAPLTARFLAMDTRTLAVHPSNKDLVLAQVYGFARWRGVEDGFLVVDCAGSRQVRLTETARITDAGELTGAEWVPMAPEDDIRKVACQEG
jgi:hypothetical protein